MVPHGETEELIHIHHGLGRAEMAAFASIESSIIFASMFLSLLIVGFYFLPVLLYIVVCSKMEAQTQAQAQAHKPSGIRWKCYTKSI